MKKMLVMLMAAVCLALCASGAMAERTAYVERLWDGRAVVKRTKTADCTVIGADSVQWDAGWYVVKGSVTIAERIAVTGDVHLVLADGAKLTANKGIQAAGESTLTIYGQSRGTGELIAGVKTDAAQIGSSCAGIGGSQRQSSGLISIHGGRITATGGAEGAGIGGGYHSDGTVVITGGTVTATGGSRAAGIGGGSNSKGMVTIHGGTVTATGGVRAAGIGGGGGTNGRGTVEITGGTIVATGGECVRSADGIVYAGDRGGAGIGGGVTNGSNTVTISGGRITATGGADAAGIGSGFGGTSSVTITGGSIMAAGGETSASVAEGSGAKFRWGAAIARAQNGVGTATIAEGASIHGRNREREPWTAMPDDENLLAAHYRYAHIELTWEALLEDGVLDLPQTGDPSMLGAWAALLAASAAGMKMKKKK